MMLAKISLYCILNKERNEVSQDLAKRDKSWPDLCEPNSRYYQ